jgi:gluconate 2-dehydrogenase alpha chain
MQNVRRETLTFRSDTSQTALPMRQLGSFLPGYGVGGAGVHWNGVTWRWLKWDHQAHKRTVERYGKTIIPEGMHLQDWPITYDDLEPYYDRFEKTCGTSGKAGNLNAKG